MGLSGCCERVEWVIGGGGADTGPCGVWGQLSPYDHRTLGNNNTNIIINIFWGAANRTLEKFYFE